MRNRQSSGLRLTRPGYEFVQVWVALAGMTYTVSYTLYM